MNCNEISDKLSLYIDNELSDEEMLLIEEHIKFCESCQKELEEYKNLISILQSLPEEEPPEGYCERLHNKLTEVNINQEKTSKIKRYKFKWMKYASIAAALVLVMLVYGLNNFGTSTKNEAAYDMAQSGSMPAPAAEEAPASMENYDQSIGEYQPMENRTRDSVMIATEERETKTIKTGTLFLQTENYDEFFNSLSQKISSLEGFLESNNTEVNQSYNDRKLMYGNLRIRVPQENFYEMIDYLEVSGEVIRKNIDERDMTKEYYEKDNKVKNLEIQEERLRELFEDATTVEEMLLIENELRRIRTEIDTLNISLTNIDDRVSMSTINLEVQEVLSVSLTLRAEDSVWERAKDGFIHTINSIIRSLENLFVNIVSTSPILIPAIIIAIVAFFKIKKYWRQG